MSYVPSVIAALTPVLMLTLGVNGPLLPFDPYDTNTLILGSQIFTTLCSSGVLLCCVCFTVKCLEDLTPLYSISGSIQSQDKVRVTIFIAPV